ncbi:lactose permease [Emericellopsis atlantica]|uniref:Lactose permease n=1 Tax=Emericellopsis atlantica TaxID=2614577 RepID=A0A9P7ZR20_9HYPO|nr:lactose permease [Emericellopsis atlantica]KAG9256759.1 lactose permease [Emericellopsis atlantica]
MSTYPTDKGEEPPRASFDEKPTGGALETREVAAASVALEAAIAESKPSLVSPGMLRLWCIMGMSYLVSTMNGFDSSLMGAINAMEPYQRHFGLSGAGSSTGIVFITYNLGQIAAFPFMGILADGFGRRWCIFIGCLIVCIGTAVQAPAETLPWFIGGRFILGFGASIASAAAPAYAVELSHPAYRGLMSGMYNNLWWLGNILAGWTTYGTNLHFDNSWAWRVPTLVQCGMPAVVMLVVMFFPESPRWLIAKDRTEEALQILAKYHGDGNVNHALVQLQYHEIIEQRNMYRDENPWWDFRELFNTPGARYRTYMVIMMSFFGQWSGNNVVSYFMPQMIETAGITNTNTQLLINAINPIFSMMGAIAGAAMLDKLGRRPMMMYSLGACLVFYILLTAFSAHSADVPGLSYGVIVAIYLFGIFFAWGFTPLQTLYSVECLENRTRAKGSGVNFLFLNIAMVINTYGISEGMAKIGWKLYIVYCAWIAVEIVVIYFFAVETAGKTLEELSSIFNAKNPRKESTRKTKIEVDESGNVLNIGGQ